MPQLWVGFAVVEFCMNCLGFTLRVSCPGIGEACKGRIPCSSQAALTLISKPCRGQVCLSATSMREGRCGMWAHEYSRRLGPSLQMVLRPLVLLSPWLGVPLGTF
ncbi:RAB31, member RAS oncogene family, isoform CRA_b [Rattus norvegicus]|uniref:RAB31, member RAS oncogene family, isoform CRA_b n=1 Tax=Rattus norvegicus TaxID=10116 RepID=A6JRC2_RAT|nr:RAB31, member RAS oncogene family, isoform CRA_b [Rattus norvegicus]EDL91816.1 RAB31, member RAS oncogene family, isoform CRA_b [Rattus norvegicus]